MNSKPMIYLCIFVGSVVGGWVPTLWGAGFLSWSGLIFSTIGGLAGLFLALKFL